MRAVLVVALAVVVVLIGIPSLVVSNWGGLSPTPPDEETPTHMINLYVTSTKQLVSMPLEEYIKGVVAAEMPASFHIEALKAQAVAARTYVVKRARAFGGKGCNSHPGADVCDSPGHCQAWLPSGELQQRWGMIEYPQHWAKISQAVESTAGKILTHQGVAIDPVYHSTCGGETEDAGQVWQVSLPYLQPKTCGYCTHSPRFTSQQAFSLSAFLTVVRELDGAIAVTAQQLSGAAPPISIAARTATGRVQSMLVGGRNLLGTRVRYALGLNSTRFTYTIANNQIIFDVKGFGHGVGMCQYGADGMANSGKRYDEILRFYYTGVMITNVGR